MLQRGKTKAFEPPMMVKENDFVSAGEEEAQFVVGDARESRLRELVFGEGREVW
jgi:hypothetical protein